MSSRREGIHVPAVRVANEKSLGITERCTPTTYSWTGDNRKRYTDFLVYEIRKNGTTVHLREYEVDEEQEKLAQTALASQAGLDGRNFTPTGFPTSRNFTHGTGARQSSPAPVLPAPAPTPAPAQEVVVKTVSEEDQNILEKLIGKTCIETLVKLDLNAQAKKPMSFSERSVTFAPITDRPQRAALHHEIRRIFDGRIETVADSNGVITAMPTKPAVNNGRNGYGNGNRGARDGRGRDPNHKSFAALGGDYLHFTLYKENKDTMDAINTIARLLKIKASNFGFAGTKDRRASTVQRVSVFRQRKKNLLWLNSRLDNVKVGQFSHQKSPLQLGQHGGNEFIITLKNCQPVDSGFGNVDLKDRLSIIHLSVEVGLASLMKNGYLNYFGLQRFGTYSIGTHLLGMKILNAQYESVVNDILHVEQQYLDELLDNCSPQGQGPGKDTNRDDISRARAITIWKTNKNTSKAFEHLPKRFSSEFALMNHLDKNPTDYMGAILCITRGMRMMYIHAYQSYIWNHAASYRWKHFGAEVMVGDLVLADTSKGEDKATVSADDSEACYAQARPLTEEDVASKKYTIFDIVLPTPGYDVIYPQNEVGTFYAEFMGREENGSLSPYDMRRRHKEFSLSGNYRNLIGQFITEPEYVIKLYADDTQQMYPTDLDFAKHNRALQKAGVKPKREATSASPEAARWAQFAGNPAAFDGIMAEDRRRKASESPKSDGPTVTNDTWVQTGIDDGAKRVKLTRHQDILVADDQGTGDAIAQDSVMEGVVSTTAANGDAQSAPGAVDTTVEATPVAIKVENETSLLDAAPASIKPENDIGVAPPMGLSEYYYSGVPIPATPTNPEGSENIENGTSAPTGVADPMNWYGGALAFAPPPVPVKEESKEQPKPSAPEIKIGHITLPTFEKPSDNLISLSRDFSDEIAKNPKAQKIAVVLKFQLKSSNYATVVLRELMGVEVADTA
ncbi:pseudouridine synthase [Podospora conica]|nr:pseudouridine synthase [Schizothecium conicum]